MPPASTAWALERAIIRRGWHQAVDRQAWARQGEKLIAEHQELWLARRCGGGLLDSCSRYQTVIAPWQDAKDLSLVYLSPL